MALILEVDFKKKCRINKIPHVEKYQWGCSYCRTRYNYSSDSEHNVKRITMEYGNITVDLCKSCIDEMHDLMKEDT